MIIYIQKVIVLGCGALANSVLSAAATYNRLALPIPKLANKEIHKISWDFIWNKEDSKNLYGGHSLVKYKILCRSKALGPRYCQSR